MSVMAENEVSHSKLPCHRCGKEFQTNWHLKRHSKTCSEKCQCYKEKTEQNLADYVCNLTQVRVPVGRYRQRALNVEENQIMDTEYPQNFQTLILPLSWIMIGISTFIWIYKDLKIHRLFSATNRFNVGGTKNLMFKKYRDLDLESALDEVSWV